MTQLPPHHHTDRLIQRLERDAHQMGIIISWFNSLLGFLMANQQDLMNEIAVLKQAVVDDQAADQAVVDALDKVITDLQASGDTSAAIAALQDIQAQIVTVTTTTTPPTTPPPTTPSPK